MENETMKTLVVGPSIHMNGGITTVIRMQNDSEIWGKWNCCWVGTTLSRGFGWKLLWFFTALVRFIILLPGTRIVHIHLTDGKSARRKSVFFWLAFWSRKKTIIHFHAPSFPESEAARRFAPLAPMFTRANRVVALSRSWAELIIKNIPMAHVAIIPNAVVAPESVLNFEDRSRRIVFAGILIDRKGYKELIQAFYAIANHFPDWTMILAGDGEVELARSIVKKLDLEGRIMVPGWVDRSDMLELLRGSQVFCLPSRAEGFPMTVLEAFAFGCAVVTTPVGGLAEELVDGHDLLFVEPGNAENLAKVLTLVLGDELLRQRLCARSRTLSEERYSIEASMQKLDELYSEVAG